MKIIALEEHYLDPEVARHFKEGGPEARDAQLREWLLDVGELRIREMDEAGIDIQVLSHSAPAARAPARIERPPGSVRRPADGESARGRR